MPGPVNGLYETDEKNVSLLQDGWTEGKGINITWNQASVKGTDKGNMKILLEIAQVNFVDEVSISGFWKIIRIEIGH